MLHHACVPTHPEPTSQDTLRISDPKIFISHIPILNFAGTTRNRLHHACEPTHPEPTSQNTLQTSDLKIFISHIPVFHACVPTHPEPTSQDTLQTSIRKFSSHTSLFELCRNRLHLTYVPALNQCCIDTPQNLRPQEFHLTHPCFELCRSSSILHHTCEPTHPEPRSQDTLQTSFENVHLTFELCRNNPEQITPRM